MRILLTGPSCAGKTSLARNLQFDEVVSLDPCHTGARDAPATDGSAESVLFEGMLSGSTDTARRFLATIDLVLILEVGLFRRAVRALARDGLGEFPRFVKNEWWWRRQVAPVITSHPNTQWIRWEPE